MKISALWITKNEAANLARSVESVRAVADELVVVDTGSSDGTVALAESLGARVEHFEWVDDFSAARNWALSKTDGDVVLFMDADEWFAPALAGADRRVLEERFADGKLLLLATQRTNVDPDTELVVSVDEVMRIMRGKGAAQYVGVIHEHPRENGGHRYVTETMPGWNIQHSGYGKERSREKLVRNKALLEQAVARMPDNVLNALYHYYLMRESLELGLDDAAFGFLVWLMDHPALLRQVLKDFSGVAAHFAFNAIRLAAARRQKCSRQQVKSTVVDAAQEALKNQPAGEILELFYQLYFAPQDLLLLSELEETIARAEALRTNASAGMEDTLRAYVDLYTAAGEAAERFGLRERAFDYATKAITQTEAAIRPETVALLLRCVKGLPASDVTLFFSSILPTEKRGVLEKLVATLHYEGFSDLYAFFMKKLLDAGWAKKSDFWYLMIVLGKAWEAAQAAFEARDNTEAATVQRTLFLAIACSQDAEMFKAYEGELGAYAPALECLFGQGHAAGDFRVAMENYHLIAFAAGRAAANRFLNVYEGMDRACFFLRAQYYSSAGLYNEFLQDQPFRPGAEDAEAKLLLCRFELMGGNHQGALWQLQAILQKAPLSAEFFSLCAAIVHTAQADTVRQEAAKIYDQYLPLYEEWVDMADVVNTGLVYTSDSKKQRRALSQLSLAAFDTMVAPESAAPFHGQLGTLRAAAAILQEKKAYEAALDCYCRLIAYRDRLPETYHAAAALFTTLDNPALAEALARRAEE
ncbi:MAG: glycosyltransferase family 2 protein [Oscillospiraceae bacterium]